MAILSELAAEHQDREACARDAEAIELTHLVTDGAEPIGHLKAAFVASYRRWLDSSSRFRP